MQPRTRINRALELGLDAVALLHEQVHSHDVHEWKVLEELRALHLGHADEHRREAAVHERAAERIGWLLARDERENEENAQALVLVRQINQHLSHLAAPQTKPAA